MINVTKMQDSFELTLKFFAQRLAKSKWKKFFSKILRSLFSYSFGMLRIIFSLKSENRLQRKKKEQESKKAIYKRCVRVSFR